MTPEVILCQLKIEQVVTQIFVRRRISRLDRELLISPLRSGDEIDEREHNRINLREFDRRDNPYFSLG